MYMTVSMTTPDRVMFTISKKSMIVVGSGTRMTKISASAAIGSTMP